LQALLKETEDQLGKLPAPPSDDAQGEIVSLVSDFARELATYIDGTPDDNGIHQLIRPLNKAFLEEIRSTAQPFSPFERAPHGRGTPFKHPELLISGMEPDIYNGALETICINDVMVMANRARARELPGHSLYIVTKRLIKRSTEQWDAPSYELLQEVYDNLAREVNKRVDDYFHRFRYGRLHQDVKSIVNEVLEKCRASAFGMIKLLLIMEGKAPSTLHEPYLTECREKVLRKYSEARVRLTSNRPEELVALDESSQALGYMANARAYFLVAFRRFTDLVPMMIDQELLRGLDWDRGLVSALTKGLGITGPGSFEKAMEYLQEPPDVRRLRENLSGKRERLLCAKRELQSI